MPRRLLPYLVAVFLVVGGMVALAVRPVSGAPQRTADYVVIAGAPGLRWEDIDPVRTPTLWAMAESGAIGSLSVRSARQPTCPVDGWLTLGAGNYAAWGAATTVDECPPLNVTVERPDGIGANLPQERDVVRYNERQAWGALPGALAESVRCTVAVGPGAAVAAARPFGRVDRYEPQLPGDPAELLSACVLSIVDLGTIAGEDPVRRAAATASADATLARVLAARPDRSLVMVAGLSDTDPVGRLHVAIADGPGWERGWLTSGSTARDGYLALVDLAPTALTALGRTPPVARFEGHAATATEGRPADLRAAIARPADADREARAQARLATWFYGLLVAVQFILYAALVPLLRRSYRHVGPPGPPAPPARLLAAMEVALVASALALPAALVADAVPWWRSDHGGLVFAAVTLGLLALATAAVRFTPLYRASLGPMGLAAGGAALAVVTDVLTGSTLQLNGVAGYSTLAGGRYAGIGTVGLGVLAAGALLTAGVLAQRLRRSWRPVVVVAVGGMAVIMVGSPYLGADAVGAVALTAGVCVAAAISTGGWLTFARLAWATVAGVAVTIGFAVLDLRRPVEQRGSLGRIVAAFVDGTSGVAVHRTGASNVAALASSPLTILAVMGAVLVWVVLLRPWGGLKRLYGLHPAIRAAMAGTAVAVLIAGALGGSALHVAGAAAALAVPLAALTALRVLEHAADRTRPPVLPLIERTPPDPTPPDPPPANPVPAGTAPDDPNRRGPTPPAQPPPDADSVASDPPDPGSSTSAPAAPVQPAPHRSA